MLVQLHCMPLIPLYLQKVQTIQNFKNRLPLQQLHLNLPMRIILDSSFSKDVPVRNAEIL